MISRTSRKRTTRTDRRPQPVALGLGSNEGDRELQLRQAIETLAILLGDIEVSSPYRTRALCSGDQPFFLNAAVVGTWRSEPENLLALCKGLEWAAGRRPGPRNGPRPLDIDLLLFGARVIQQPELTIPHPRLRERQFVLAPLAQIASDFPVPPDGVRVGELLAALPAEQGVEKQEWTAPVP